MSSSILNIGVQALNANQTALSYVGQNIANVNTEGYSRQTVHFGTQDPPILGVGVKDINRVTDDFLIRQVWSDTANFSSNEAFSEKIALLDSMLVSESTSLSAGMDDYFAALQQVVDDPLFIANRELFLAEASTLANSFNDFVTKLRAQTDTINTEIRSMTDTVNSITQNIADLNVQISVLEASGQNSNELQDRRDLLVKELSGYVSTNVISQDGITFNVMMSNGQALVVGSTAARLQVRTSESDPTQVDIYMMNGFGAETRVTDQVGNGAIGGLIRYRDEALQPAINEVGRLAVVFSETMNEQHKKGMDLNGDMGENLFRDIQTGDVTANAQNKSLTTRASVSFYDVTELTASDYQLEITGDDSFVIVRLSDGERIESADLTDLNTLPADEQTLAQSGVYRRDSNALSISLDGITIRLDGQTPVGDSYLVQPTRSAAQRMGVEITNPKMLALASPLRVEPATTNSGNAEVSSVEIGGAQSSSALREGVTVSLELVFNADGSFSLFDTRDSDDPQRVELLDADGNPVTSLPYAPGEPIAFRLAGSAAGQQAGELDSYDFRVTLEKQPNPGDRFIIERNTNGYSDNTNALAMSNLQNAELVNGFSYQDTYGQMLAKVGTQASTAEIALNSSQSILQASENALQSVAGVNLDEEAANLVKFQQAYTASAQLITAYQTIFDSLITAVRR